MDDHVEIANLIYTYAEPIDLGDFDGVGHLVEFVVDINPHKARS